MKFSEKLEQALLFMEAAESLFGRAADDLGKLGVPYLIVGGLAVGHHGWARFTKDLDIVMNADDYSNITNNEFEVGDIKGDLGVMRHVQTGVHIDVLLGGQGKFPRVEELTADPNTNVVSIEDLIWLKTIRGEPSDLAADVFKILKDRKEPVDWARVKKIKDRPGVLPKNWVELVRIVNEIPRYKGKLV